LKFKVSQDFDAPTAQVWARLTDFTGIEAEAAKREASLVRVGEWQTPKVGVSWRGAVPVRGKSKPIEARIVSFEHEDMFRIDSRVGGMEADYDMTLVALTPVVTRVEIALDLSAKTLSARLLLQTLKLARKRVLGRLDGMLERQGQAAEADWRRVQSA
jgi:hypothetical protein